MTTTSSGDDHLLTANAHDEHFRYFWNSAEHKKYHDNQAFQYHHNNNTLPKNGGASKSAGKLLPADEFHCLHGNDALDVVIVQRRDSMSKLQILPATGLQKATALTNISGALNASQCKRGTCRLHHHQHGSNHVRQRHNATQTPNLGMNWQQLTPICCYCSGNAGEINVADVHCHCHITHHHCHRYSPSSVADVGEDVINGERTQRHAKKRKSCKQRRSNANEHFHQHHHELSCRHHHHCRTQHSRRSSQRHHNHQQHQQREHRNPTRQLPAYNSKSSIDSSDDQQQRTSEQLQEIAIEIDAATMTEDNTTTATSNFAYKMATDNVRPIIRAPLHDENDGHKRLRHHQHQHYHHQHQHHRDSLNSNTTAETDELSRDNDDAEADDNCVTSTFTSERDDEFDDDNRTSRAICNENTQPPPPARNECVKIKRKHFIANATHDDCCSSCSRCSSCTCSMARTSSCSSLDDFEMDERASHELVVSVDCHRCNLQRTSITSTGDEDVDDEFAIKADTQIRHRPQTTLLQDTRDSSLRSSRHSSDSFCSCHSTSCCYCSCDCDDCETSTQMRTARDGSSLAAITNVELDEQHSSTLTPLTNPSSLVSTPQADDADVTLCSLSHVMCGDEGSSLSQSAEYFSLSSSNPQSQATPTVTPIHTATMALPNKTVSSISEMTEAAISSNRKPCKHYSKHHRHKRISPPLDAYL